MKLARSTSELLADGGDSIPPDPALLIRALRQIGYSLESAIADLVDNSITAGARTILIRFVTDSAGIQRLVVADDGEGMTAARLRTAMKFGSDQNLTQRSLGKFGMGLKLASLSHGQSLTVLTRRDGKASGRRWTVSGIERGWECDSIATSDADELLDAPWSQVRLARSGTLVIWEDIDRLPTNGKGIRDTLRSIQRRLQLHLGLCFHRFLEADSVRILLDQQMLGTSEQPHFVAIRPLNPFGYRQSGRPDYPKAFAFDLGPKLSLTAVAHIWPANSSDPEYKLGNKAASRQGFYFYRNDRLIQAGGWNGLVQHDSEPHSSLARISVDVSESFDSIFSLNVQKSAVIAPSNFISAVMEARADDGRSFEEFRRHAQQTYRRQDSRAERDLSLIPGSGFPTSLAAAAKALAGSVAGRSRAINFSWAELVSSDDVFEIDASQRMVRLNVRYRAALLGGRRASRTDVATLKTCLFLLLAPEFDRDRMTADRRRRLQEINVLLLAAVKSESGRSGLPAD